MTDKDSLDEELRRQTAAYLPRAIARALDSYRDFMRQDMPGDAKEFGNIHQAGKAAIAHVELLLKLARWAQGDPAGDDTGRRLDAAMRQAAAETQAWRDRQDDPPPGVS